MFGCLLDDSFSCLLFCLLFDLVLLPFMGCCCFVFCLNLVDCFYLFAWGFDLLFVLVWFAFCLLGYLALFTAFCLFWVVLVAVFYVCCWFGGLVRFDLCVWVWLFALLLFVYWCGR